MNLNIVSSYVEGYKDYVTGKDQLVDRKSGLIVWNSLERAKYLQNTLNAEAYYDGWIDAQNRKEPCYSVHLLGIIDGE